MYTQILKEILLTIDFQQEHFMAFITYCRTQFNGNLAELGNVDKLEKNIVDSTPIWWYTYHCFLYSMLNCALRTMEVDLIIKLGFSSEIFMNISLVCILNSILEVITPSCLSSIAVKVCLRLISIN